MIDCNNGVVNTGAGRPDETGDETTRRSTLPNVDPVIVVLTLAGIFDGLAGNPVHAFLLIGIALLLVSGADLHVRPTTRMNGHHPLAALAVAVVFAVVVGGFERYSWPATVAVIVPGVAGLLMAFRAARTPGPEPLVVGRHGAVAWASLFVVLGLWELTNLLLQPDLATASYAHPTLSTLLDPILAMHTGRSVLLFVWLALGWHLVKR